MAETGDDAETSGDETGGDVDNAKALDDADDAEAVDSAADGSDQGDVSEEEETD
jgi:hypothetical protein